MGLAGSPPHVWVWHLKFPASEVNEAWAGSWRTGGGSLASPAMNQNDVRLPLTGVCAAAWASPAVLLRALPHVIAGRHGRRPSARPDRTGPDGAPTPGTRDRIRRAAGRLAGGSRREGRPVCGVCHAAPPAMAFAARFEPQRPLLEPAVHFVSWEGRHELTKPLAWWLSGHHEAGHTG